MKVLSHSLEIAGRILIAAPFVMGGLGYLKDKPGRTALVGKLGYLRPQAVALIDAAAKLGGGFALVSGVESQLVAAALIANLAPTTVAMFPFWRAHDAGVRAMQRNQFVMNLSLAGGLLVVIGRRVSYFDLK